MSESIPMMRASMIRALPPDEVVLVSIRRRHALARDATRTMWAFTMIATRVMITPDPTLALPSI